MRFEEKIIIEQASKIENLNLSIKKDESCKLKVNDGIMGLRRRGQETCGLRSTKMWLEGRGEGTNAKLDQSA